MRLFVLTLFLCLAANAQQNPKLPRVFLTTTYPALTGKSINVPAGGDLQAAINSANLGDEIVLAAGATYTGNFVLPAKTGSGWIVIRSSQLSSMPESIRVGPGTANYMAKIVTPNTAPVFANNTNGAPSDRLAQFYRFSGLEITTTPSAQLVWNMIFIDNKNSLDPAGLPHDIIVDRCWVHGNGNVGMDRGIWMGGARMAVIDSYFSDFHDIGYETQAIYCESGPGPYKIVNNYLEASGENVYFGTPPFAGIIPSDIVIRRNYIAKPAAWQSQSWTVKNLLEIKNAQRVIVDQNIFENNWPNAQNGFALVMVPRTNYGQFPFALAQDISITRNVIRNAGGALNVAGMDDMCSPSAGCVQSHRVLFQGNLVYNVNQNGGAPGFVIQSGFMSEFTIDHNTMQALCTVGMCWGQFVVNYPTKNEIVTNNIFNQNLGGNGMIGPSVLFNNSPVVVSNNSGNALANNLVVAPGFDGSITQAAVAAQWTPYSPATFYAGSMDSVGFADLANNNFALLSSSPYKGKGTDGKDLGYDPTQIDVNNIVQGINR
jgi:hypothetical protein